jgi:MFS family permease
VSFLPTFIQFNDWKSPDGYVLNEGDIGLILSTFSIAQIIFAPFNAVIKNRIGSKNTILFGFFLVTVSTFGLGIIAHIYDPLIFKWIAVGLRFF